MYISEKQLFQLVFSTCIVFSCSNYEKTIHGTLALVPRSVRHSGKKVCNMVLPVFTRSITASRSTQNYGFLLITFGDTPKSVKCVFTRKLNLELVFQRKLLTSLGAIWEGKHTFWDQLVQGTLCTLLDVTPKVINRNL